MISTSNNAYAVVHSCATAMTHCTRGNKLLVQWLLKENDSKFEFWRFKNYISF